jgi:HSP20 family molecular chaperone IbpA
VTKQFEQRFTLPSGVKSDAISSSLSRDGVLVVTAPRSVEQHKTPIGEIKWKTRDGFESDSQSPAQSFKSEEGLPHPKVKYDEDKVCISLDCQKYKPEELDVKVEGNTIIITAKQEVKEIGGTRTRVFEQKFTLPSGVKGEKVTSSIDKDGVLNIIAPRGNPSASTINQTIEQKMDRVMSPSSWASDFGTGGRTTYDDDFSGPRRSSSSTVTKSSTNSSAIPGSIMFDHGDDFKNERSLFSHSEAMDSNDGISKVQYDDDTYKIMVNVENYNPDELTIKTVGNAVQVEAKHMEKTSDGRSFSSRNFSQSFSLPKGVNPDDVKSSLSKDGTLTIEAPLPQPKAAIKGSERMVPITHHR